MLLCKISQVGSELEEVEQHSPKQVILNYSFMIPLSRIPSDEDSFCQLFLLSMYEQATRHDEEGRPEDGEVEVNIYPHLTVLNPLLPLSRKA